MKTRNIIKYIMSDQVAKKLTWMGVKQTIGIKDSGFANIIIGN